MRTFCFQQQRLFTVFEQQQPSLDDEDNASTSSVSETVIKAFSSQFFDPLGEVEALTKYVTACCDSYYSPLNNWYSPYITLCQSSGWGKSRLIREMSRLSRVAYISFMSPNSTGYPARTTGPVEAMKACSLLTDDKKTEVEKIQNFLKDVVSRTLELDLYLDAEEDTADYWKALCGGEVEWDSFRDGMNQMAKEAKNKSRRCREDDKLVVIVFDEAREMLDYKRGRKTSLFLQTRRALINLAKDQNNRATRERVFAIFADTSSRLTNYSPPTGAMAPSDREREGELLFRPFIPSGFMDVISKRELGRGAQADAWKADAWTMREHVFSLGRPLWKSVSEPVELAASKLVLGRPETEQSALAVFLARVGLYLSPCHPLTSELVANHMASLLAVNAQRTALLVSYVSEPCLAMGAQKYWKNTEYFIEHVIPAVRRALFQGAVLEGVLGEMVGACVFLHAADSVKQSQEDWVKLEDFLTTLVGDTKIVLDGLWQDKTKALSDCLVGVNHFVQWSRDLTVSDLKDLVMRRAGAFLRRNQDGADLVIPFWGTARKESEDVDMLDAYQSDQPKSVRKMDVGMLVVQVKNCIGHQDMRVVGYKLHNNYVFSDLNDIRSVPTINFVFELGLRRNQSSKHNNRNIKPELLTVSIEVEDDQKGVYTVKTSNSTKGLVVNKCNIPASTFTVVRMKGLSSFSFFAQNSKLEDGLKSLLLGPIDPVNWKDEHTNGSDDPQHKIHLHKMCLGLQSKEQNGS